MVARRERTGNSQYFEDILVDQCPRREKGILVPFFEKRAWAHRGPAVLALRSRATLLPAFIVDDPDRPGCYLIRFGAPIEPERTGDTEEDVRRLTARFQRVMEDEIRSRPEDWLWIHRRWKRSPDAEGLYPVVHHRHRRVQKSAGTRARIESPDRAPEE